MMRRLSLYFFFAKKTIRETLYLRGSFVAGVIGQWLAYGGSCLTLFIMVSTFHTLGGWSGYDIVFLFGYSTLTYAMAACVFFNPCMRLAPRIRSGEFDGALTKPVDPLWHEVCHGFNFGYIGHTILSLFLIVLSLVNLGISFTFPRALLIIAMLAGSALIESSLFLFSSAFSFLTIGDNPVIGLLRGTLKQFTDYPLSIYARAVQFIFTFVLPYAFINFYPAGVILGKQDTFAFGAHIGLITPLVGLLLFGLSILFWHRALRRYQSSGS